MDISDLLQGRERVSAHRTCRARELLQKADFTTDTFNEIWAYVDSPDAATAPALSKFFESYGIPLSIDAIRRHRRRECACPDPKDNDE